MQKTFSVTTGLLLVAILAGVHVHLSSASCQKSQVNRSVNKDEYCVGSQLACTDTFSTKYDDIGVNYEPYVWYSYCSFQFDCNFNANTTSNAVQLFSAALRLSDNIPLYDLANLSTYVVSFTRCSAACLVSMFDMYKHFNSTKDYYFSISNSDIGSVDVTSLLFYNNTLPYYIRQPRLQLLNLSHNVISTITNVNVSTCARSSYLAVLDLSYNNITSADSLLALCCINGPQELYLGSNSVDGLPSMLTSCLSLNLTVLDVSNNRIDSLSSWNFTALTLLQTLDLSDNKLTAIQQNSFPSSLQHLKLRGNNLMPAICSQVLWLQSISDIAVNASQCSLMSSSTTGQTTSLVSSTSTSAIVATLLTTAIGGPLITSRPTSSHSLPSAKTTSTILSLLTTTTTATILLPADTTISSLTTVTVTSAMTTEAKGEASNTGGAATFFVGLGQIVGAVVGTFLATCLVAIVIFILIFKCRKSSSGKTKQNSYKINNKPANGEAKYDDVKLTSTLSRNYHQPPPSQYEDIKTEPEEEPAYVITEDNVAYHSTHQPADRPKATTPLGNILPGKPADDVNHYLVLEGGEYATLANESTTDANPHLAVNIDTSPVYRDPAFASENTDVASELSVVYKG